jgi:NADPH-dependent ferric siderophore reductase
MLSTNRPAASADLTIRRVRHPLEMRRVQVVRATQVTPFARSVTFTGDRLSDFVSASFDDHVKLVLPFDPRDALVLPVVGPDGPSGAPRPESAPPIFVRDYTPRRFDRASHQLHIEFDLRGDGPASRWARAATAGFEAGIGGPRGSFVVPSGFAWELYIGDETAFPAIARRLEEVPSSALVFVVGLAESDDARRAFSSRADLSVAWAATPAELVHLVRTLPLLARPGYAWASGESAMMRAVRTILRDEHRLPSTQTRVTAYWKRGVADHHEAIV